MTGENDRRTRFRFARLAIPLVLVSTVAYVSGLIPRTQPFRERAFHGQWLDGLGADLAAGILGDSQERDLWWYYLGPAGEANSRNDYMFGDLDRAALLVRFGSEGTVLFSYVLRHSEIEVPQDFIPAKWQAARGADRLAMAHSLVQSRSLIGLSAGEVKSILGHHDDERHFLVYRISDGLGTDPRRLPIGYDGRIDHSLPCDQ